MNCRVYELMNEFGRDCLVNGTTRQPLSALFPFFLRPKPTSAAHSVCSLRLGKCFPNSRLALRIINYGFARVVCVPGPCWCCVSSAFFCWVFCNTMQVFCVSFYKEFGAFMHFLCVRRCSQGRHCHSCVCAGYSRPACVPTEKCEYLIVVVLINTVTNEFVYLPKWWLSADFCEILPPAVPHIPSLDRVILCTADRILRHIRRWKPRQVPAPCVAVVPFDHCYFTLHFMAMFEVILLYFGGVSSGVTHLTDISSDELLHTHMRYL
jgi:hypothetical protein